MWAESYKSLDKGDTGNSDRCNVWALGGSVVFETRLLVVVRIIDQRLMRRQLVG